MEIYFRYKEGDKFVKWNRHISELPNDIEYLNLNGNILNNLPTIINKFTNLKTLDLSNNNLAQLPIGIFDKFIYLEYLYLGRNNLTDLPIGIFDKLINLKTLDLNDNKLTNLPIDIL